MLMVIFTKVCESVENESRISFYSKLFVGQWNQGTRSGYGVLTKRNGDHYEGHWVDDKREGQGSFFFSAKRKLFIGEWVNDQPKCGVYTEVQDEEFERPKVEHFQEKYVLPEVPKIGLANPTKILEDAMERARKDRAAFRYNIFQFSKIRGLLQNNLFPRIFLELNLSLLKRCLQTRSLRIWKKPSIQWHRETSE